MNLKKIVVTATGKILFCLSLSLGAISLSGQVHAKEMSKVDMQRIVNQGVFQVLLRKPIEDPLEYEKPLPMDLIPFSIRNDKYISIGSAFLIEDNTFMSAAHVLLLERHTQYKEMYIRAFDKSVYKIKNIQRYVKNRDYVIFTVDRTYHYNENDEKIIGKKIQFKMPFKIKREASLNETVFAVGNALWEGIIMREGLLTSKTFEGESGKWKWFRFSAATSPGNSGGPLLDKEGNIIGVVLKKSANENLNYALPISEALDNHENEAFVHMKLIYYFPNMKKSLTGIFETSMPLPDTYENVRATLAKQLREYLEKKMEEYFQGYDDEIFPKGEGTATLLYSSSLEAFFPCIISETDSGQWIAFYPENIAEATLDNNGRLLYGSYSFATQASHRSTMIIKMEKPDDISVEELIKNSKLFLDLILKGIYLPRTIMREEIRITSMGKAYKTKYITDSHSRQWIINYWYMPYSDQQVVALSLPTPQGVVSLASIHSTGSVDHVADLKKLLDFLYIDYAGTLKEWKEFLALKEVLPQQLKKVIFSYDDQQVTFETSRFKFKNEASMMRIFDKSGIDACLAFFKEGDQVVYDFVQFNYYEHVDKGGESFILSKILKPIKGMKKEFFTHWEKISNMEYPFDYSSETNDGITTIMAPHPKFQNNKNEHNSLYVCMYFSEGEKDKKFMREKIKLFEKNVEIK